MNRISQWCFCLVLSCHAAFAGESSPERDALVRDFAETTGTTQIIANTKAQAKESAKSQGETMIANLRKTGLSEPALSEIQLAFDEYMTRVLSSWDAVEANRIYTQIVAESMSDDEIRKAIAFYKSSEGKQSSDAISRAAAGMQKYIQESTQREMDSALKGLMDKVRAIATRDRAEKK